MRPLILMLMPFLTPSAALCLVAFWCNRCRYSAPRKKMRQWGSPTCGLRQRENGSLTVRVQISRRKKMNKGLFFIFAAFWVSSSFASENGVPQVSLFFTPQETYEASMLARRAPPERKGDIHLGAVLYYGKDDWTLWLQGEKWTPTSSLMPAAPSVIRYLVTPATPDFSAVSRALPALKFTLMSTIGKS